MVLLSPQDADAWCVYDGAKYKFFPAGKYWRALIPVGVDTLPKTASKLVVYAGNKTEQKQLLVARIYHKNPHFPVVRLNIPPAKEKLYKDAKAPLARQQISSALSAQSPDQLWHGCFSVPVEGRRSAPFGQRRVRKGKTLSYHLGVDIAVPVGTPVRAVNDGTVMLAGLFPLQGNAVFIDHGQGVFSACFHMSALWVRPGDKVIKGMEIGRSGNTGISTGPHVHWSMFVHGIPVNPLEWTKKEF